MSRKIQSTAHTAIHCKTSFGGAGGNTSSQTPLITRVYKDRMTALHAIVFAASRNLSNIRTSSSEIDRVQLLTLGCGFDNSYDEYFPAGACFAVDLPDIIQSIPQRSDKDESPLKPIKQYISCDITKPAMLRAALEASNFNPSASTTILIECVLVYNSDNGTNHLLHFLSSYIKKSVVIIYDPLKSFSQSPSLEAWRCSDNYSRQFCNAFEKVSQPEATKCCDSNSRSSNMYTQCDSANVGSWSARLRSCGWPHVNVYTMQQALHLFQYAHCRLVHDASKENSSKEMKQSQEQHLLAATEFASSETVCFDEYAALAKLRQLYVVCIASTSNELFTHLYRFSVNTSLKDLYSTRVKALQARLMAAEVRLATLEKYLPSGMSPASCSTRSCSMGSNLVGTVVHATNYRESNGIVNNAIGFVQIRDISVRPMTTPAEALCASKIYNQVRLCQCIEFWLF